MPSNYEKISRPTGPSLDTNLSLPEKACLSKINTASFERSPRLSSVSSPQSDKSADPFDTDLEATMPITSTNSCAYKTNTRGKNSSDCQVWPGRDQWKMKAKEAKRKRGCTCLAGLSKRNRCIAKILIVLLIVGIAVGVGFGISKPLNAPIWGDNKNE